MIRARVFDDPYSFSVGVIFVNEGDDHPREVARFENGQLAGFETPVLGAVVEPNFRLDGEFARALLDALTAHYHGAEDTRSLRRDYDAERARVDKLTDSLAALAGKVADRITGREQKP